MSFVKCDLRSEPLPAGHDLITFKSMLHDWPAAEALGYLTKATTAMEPGGMLLIFERGPLHLNQQRPAFSLLPTLLFFRSYRPANDYVAMLEGLGFVDIAVRHIELDSPFYAVTGRKPGL